MIGFLSKGTAVTIEAGPFLNPTDGVQPLVSLTAPDATKTSIKKAGTASTGYTVNGWTHKRNGRYAINLAEGDLDTVGPLRIEFVDKDTFCPVTLEFVVIDPAVYNWLHGNKAPAIAGDTMQVDMTQAVPDVKTQTVGGALNGSALTAFGRVIRDTTNKLLKLWSPGNATGTPSAVFALDDASNPTSKTPQ